VIVCLSPLFISEFPGCLLVEPGDPTTQSLRDDHPQGPKLVFALFSFRFVSGSCSCCSRPGLFLFSLSAWCPFGVFSLIFFVPPFRPRSVTLFLPPPYLFYRGQVRSPATFVVDARHPCPPFFRPVLLRPVGAVGGYTVWLALPMMLAQEACGL